MLESDLETNIATYCEKYKNGEIAYSLPDQKLGLTNWEHNKWSNAHALFSITE